MPGGPLDGRGLRHLLDDVGHFSRGLLPRRALRGYQLEPARAIVASVREGRGLQFALVFSRQAGKDETLAQLTAYLLNLYQLIGGSIVIVAPTFLPQSAIARARLLERLDNPLNRHRAVTRNGYVVELGRASARFLPAGPGANARGETASLLLVANEAQDIAPDRWDAVFDPMAASTNATTVFSGTVWSDSTLLARQLRHLRDLERADGVRRVFTVPWEQVAAELPAYGDRVRARIAQFGRAHPFIRTEYDLEELAGAGGFVSAARRAQLQGTHHRQRCGEPGRRYALLIDVAGEEAGAESDPEEGAALRAAESRRDSTALTVVEILDAGVPGPEGALPGGAGALGALPRYHVVDRRLWTGTRHSDLHATLVDLARSVWSARLVVIDATGVGAGLASFLSAALGRAAVKPFQFTSTSKSALGWWLLAAIDSGRLKDYALDDTEETLLFWRQMAACAYQVRPGAGKQLRWGVEDARLHDDLVLSLALAAALDEHDWRPRTATGRASGAETG